MSSSANLNPAMNVWAVSFSQESLTEDLYEAGLVLVDPDSQARIRRFYHKKDSYRCLIGRLLPRLLLKQHGIAPKAASFGRTSSGKPYVRNSLLEKIIGFNISHDNGYVVMAFQIRRPSLDLHTSLSENAPHLHGADVDITSIGIDVMKVALPKYEKTLKSFVQSISDTLTPLEQRTLLEDSESHDALQRLYLVWTLKEAYTKALGLGLGFDFKRIEVDTRAYRISIDGNTPSGWEFTAFTIGTDSSDEYQVAVAQLVDTRDSEGSGISGRVNMRGRADGSSDMAGWFVHYDAVSFIRQVAEEK